MLSLIDSPVVLSAILMNVGFIVEAASSLVPHKPTAASFETKGKSLGLSATALFLSTLMNATGAFWLGSAALRCIASG